MAGQGASAAPAAPIDLQYLRTIVAADRGLLEELVALYLASPRHNLLALRHF
jgi:hypothetical protein